MSGFDWIIRTSAFNLWLAVVCCSVAAGVAAMLVLHALHLRRRRRRQQQLGHPCRGLEVAGWEGVVTLEGRLAHRLPCQRFEDGADAAAVTAEARLDRVQRGWFPVQQISAQAEDLVLRLDEDGAEIALQAPVKVVVGSQEEHPRRAFASLDLALQRRAMAADPNATQLANHRLDLRSLRSGDRVIALGRLAQRPPTGGAGSYRQSTHQWVLDAEDDGVLLAYAGPSPRRILALRGLQTSLVTAVVCGLALLGTGLKVAASPSSEHSAPVSDDALWISLADRACSQSFECQVFGECAASRAELFKGRPPTCVAQGSAGCIASRNCRLHDACSASQGYCW
jgi:hypothetical protein